MKNLLVLLIALIFMGNCYADSVSDRLVRKTDLTAYSIYKAGVKSLSFKMVVQGLLENLNKRKNLGKLKELYFTVDWRYPQKLKVKVHGLPKGFKELKEQLKMAVYARLPLIFPVEKVKMLQGYKLKYDKKSGIIRAKDPTGKRALLEVNLKILDSGKLVYVEGIGVAGSQKTSYEGKKTAWSKDKFVYDHVTIEILAKGHKSVVDHNIKFIGVRGVGVPASIKSVTKVVNLKDKSEKILSNVETVFTDYVINGAKQ